MEVVSGAVQVARLPSLLEGSGVNTLHPVEGARRGAPNEPVNSLPFEKIERVVAFDNTSQITRCYDVLRNQLINENKGRQAHLIAVTAPSVGCGVTVTAANLALSFARVHAANVLLVDANSRKPAIGRLLGLPPLSRYEELSGSLTLIEVNGTRLHVLRPGLQVAAGSGRADATRLISQIEQARHRFMPTVVIYDMPPLMVADELNVLVKDADTAVVVLAVGQSTVSDLEVCKTYLGSRSGIRVVLNKTRKHNL
jgi:protein-tyrosine kinase